MQRVRRAHRKSKLQVQSKTARQTPALLTDSALGRIANSDELKYDCKLSRQGGVVRLKDGQCRKPAEERGAPWQPHCCINGGAWDGA